MKDFRRLKVWEKVHFLTLDIYKVTARFPREEVYGLTSQMRRCSASMGANIAEGCGKQGNNELHPVSLHSVGICQRTGLSPFAGERPKLLIG
ncbi:MAG: four helix bundle protein [Candidatus Sulfotelmatobacter sp.]